MKSYPVNIIVGSRYDRYKSFNPRAGELKAERCPQGRRFSLTDRLADDVRLHILCIPCPHNGRNVQG